MVTIGLAVAGAILYWMALPPLGWSLFGWVALVPWSCLIVRKQLSGERPLRSIGFVAALFWMSVLYFIPLPHWSLWIGWPLLGAYLSLYVVGFIAAGRVLVHRYKIPGWLAIPVTWVGMELLRCHLFSGLGLAMLAHTQFQNASVIQIAELGGAYLLSFSMAAASACIAISLQKANLLRRVAAAAMAVIISGAVIGWGSWRLSEKLRADDSQDTTLQETWQAVLVQGSMDVVFASESEQRRLAQLHFEQYRDLALQARTQYPTAQLLIWPESTFLAPDLVPNESESSLSMERQIEVAALRDLFVDFWGMVTGKAALEPDRPPPHGHGLSMLTGAGSEDPVSGAIYNSVLMIDDLGNVEDRYFKNHRVPFGEYVPFSQFVPVLDRLNPNGRSITAGEGPVAMRLGGLVLSPNICFESTVPHLIRRQVAVLSAAGDAPDYLVNVTNDGWFFGTNCLDLHLACTVFRSVEMGIPAVVAANTGFSAEIDRCGQILQQGPRRATALLPVVLRSSLERPPTWYRRMGDWVWVACAGLAIAVLLISYVDRRHT